MSLVGSVLEYAYISWKRLLLINIQIMMYFTFIWWSKGKNSFKNMKYVLICLTYKYLPHALMIKYRRYDVKIWNMNRHVTFKDKGKNNSNDSPDPATISKHAAILYACKWCDFTMYYEWNVPSCGKINMNKTSVIWTYKNTLETFCDITPMPKYPIPHFFTVHHIDEFIVIIKSITIVYILWAFIIQVISQITI